MHLTKQNNSLKSFITKVIVSYIMNQQNYPMQYEGFSGQGLLRGNFFKKLYQSQLFYNQKT